jgi:hypothetical protein
VRSSQRGFAVDQIGAIPVSQKRYFRPRGGATFPYSHHTFKEPSSSGVEAPKARAYRHVASAPRLLGKTIQALPRPAFIRISPQNRNKLSLAFQKDLKCLWHIKA